MRYFIFRIFCDCCRKKFEEEDESEAELEDYAGEAGWTFREVPNGSTWDLCPKCSKLTTDELP